MAGINLGNVFGLMVVTVTLDLASIAAATTAEQTFTVPGVRLGDMVLPGTVPSTINAGLFVASARASATDQVALRVGNTTAGALDPAAATFTLFIVRPDSGIRTGVAF
jgi:hypothetical protein